MQRIHVFAWVFFIISVCALPLSTVYARYSVPDFPSCINPQGDLIASYDSGVHGIPGNGDVHEGSDRVYRLADGNVLQCFCSVSGSGIQTNWWKASSISDDETKELVSLGWTYVPSGGPWGLDPTWYMASNTPYSCLTTHIDPPARDLSQNNPSSKTDIGSVLGVTDEMGQVLGLADTGNSVMILASFVAAGVLFIAYRLSR